MSAVYDRQNSRFPFIFIPLCNSRNLSMKGSIERKKVGRSEPKIAMYPKVRVRCEVKEDEEDDVRCQTQRDSSLNSNNLQSPFSENNEEDGSQVSVAKIPKVYLPSVSASCISDVIRGSSTGINKRDTKPPYQKTKATPIPIQRPRAIVSSPDNDAMIGSINKIEERKKKKGLKE